MRYQQPAEATEAPTWGMPRGVVVLIGMAATVVAVAGMKEFASILGPVVLALVLTIAIYPLQTWLRRRGLPAWLAMVIALIVIYSFLLGLLAAMVVSVAQLATILPSYQEKFNSLVVQGRELLEAAPQVTTGPRVHQCDNEGQGPQRAAKCATLRHSSTS